MGLYVSAVPSDISRQVSVPLQEPSPFHRYLSGNDAFYLQPNYPAAAKSDFSLKELQTVNYTWGSDSKITGLAKRLLSIFNLPGAIHALIGKFGVLPAASPGLMGYPAEYIDNCRSRINFSGEWKFKRIALLVDGYKIDAAIMGNAKTFDNGRWVIASNGNAEFYEQKLGFNREFTSILAHLNSNAIVFNYPGVGANKGYPSRRAMAKAYLAVLNFLEDSKKGIGAREIIGFGHSIGGGVQGDALDTHELKKGIKYVFVKSRTFRNLKDTVSDLMHSIFGFCVHVFDWNIDTAKSSKKLKAPEIILQTANVKAYEILTDSSKIVDDGIIAAKVSLAKDLLDSGLGADKNKVVIGIPEMHNDELTNLPFLKQQIEKLLDAQ